MFEIKHMDPEVYRRQTRKSTLIVTVIFAVLGLGLSALSVALFGEPGGNNFRWNLVGVIVGLALTVLLVRMKLWHQPWMSAAVYGWRLKRSLMRITNVMHQVEAGVNKCAPPAMKLLRFYHLGLLEMHRLDGNSSALQEAEEESERHKQRMDESGIDTDQFRLDPAWLERVQESESQRV
ncbi:MAG TPA: DUF3087 domain-containing protein [Pseudomonas xinjiangensis]|uniref:DUF3087 domain-containing protein n=2 Tax=root TaxID=1 RepID=A0A7V1BKS2_9GAMM|nr:DUF3087 domain-containing protein [Halopseudomonas xinjiangensis]HEC49154.1 DUF3087 domain-containing protein [Halopseudomonas xinjiangensis]